MKKTIYILLLWFVSSSCINISAQGNLISLHDVFLGEVETIEQYYDFDGSNSVFSFANFMSHLRILGDDSLQGRGTGTKGGYLAAEYLTGYFDKVGLIPVNKGSFYQHIPMHARKPLPNSQLLYSKDDDSIIFRLGSDYLLKHNGDQTFLPELNELVFVGYGIDAPKYGYNDYQNVDVKDKIAVILMGAPHSGDPDFLRGMSKRSYTEPESKERVAMLHGAKGVILIPNLIEDPFFNWQRLSNAYDFEEISLAYQPASCFHIIANTPMANYLFEKSGYSLKEIFTMHKNGTMSSFPLSGEISFKGKFIQRAFTTPNIVGMIEGSNEQYKDSYIIVSAHYDHLGIGPALEGDSIYNGVFDNAMGVAAVLELARVLSESEMKPARSVLFLLTTGEESGLLGSQYYVQHPVVPLDVTIANINIDGIASFDEFETIFGLGKEYSTLGIILNKVASEQNVRVTDVPGFFNQDDSFLRSDHYTFACAGIPSMMVLDGVQYKHLPIDKGYQKVIDFMEHVYHSPKDDLTQRMDSGAIDQHITILYDLIMNVANTTTIPKWYQNAPFGNPDRKTETLGSL